MLPSGKTTEEVRVENEQLSIPGAEKVNAVIAEITNTGTKIRNAAAKNGLSYGGEKIEKIS